MARTRVLITGHQGFIGKHLAPFLHNNGFDVEGWEYTENKEEWPQVRSYDWVIHLGAEVDHTCQDTELLLRKNLDFSQWLFDECNEWETNLQYASCASVYGDGPDFSEHAICHPKTPYSWSKYLFDRWAFQRNHKVTIQGFRYFDVYGHQEAPKGDNASIVHKLYKQTTTGTITLSAALAKQKRDFIHVHDVCKIHLLFMQQVVGSGLWNIGTGHPHYVKDIAQAIATSANCNLEITEHEARKLNIKADLTKLKETVGPQQFVDVISWINSDDE